MAVPPRHGLHARSLVAFWVCGLSVALALNLVYDEVLWTKKIWSSAKVSNTLLYTNPSDQDPRLPEVYPSIRGSLASSLDGPNERRDGTKRPTDEADALEGLPVSDLHAVSDTSDIKPASVAAQCSVCHVAMVHVWQNLTEKLVDNLVLGPRSARGDLLSKQAVKKQLIEACKNEVAESMLSKQTILRLSEASGQVVFYVLRERRKGAKHASAIEQKAVRMACKHLVQESGSQLVQSTADMLTIFVAQLETILSQHNLLGEYIDIPPADPDDGAAKEFVPSDPTGTPWPKMWTQALQASSLVKEVLRRVWPAAGVAPGAVVPAAPALPNDDDDYEDDDPESYDPECMDLHPMCMSWADKGECEANPNYMVGSPVHKGHCKKSCGLCTPRRKGERSPAGLIDSSELKAAHPDLASKVERLALPLQQALCNSACGASKACLTGVSGTSAGQGFMQNAIANVQHTAGWQLEKPHFGRATVQQLPAKDVAALAASAQGRPPVEPGSVAAEVDEVLGAELRGKAVLVHGDFFTYEYVYRNHTRQFHVADDGSNSEDYLVGSFKRESVDMLSAATGTTSILEDKDLLPDLRPVLQRKDWAYVKQVYSGGDECVLGGGRRVVRRAEVRIACSPDKNTYMLVREPEFCHYVYVVYTPALCKVERFRPQIKPQADKASNLENDDNIDIEDGDGDGDQDEYA